VKARKTARGGTGSLQLVRTRSRMGYSELRIGGRCGSSRALGAQGCVDVPLRVQHLPFRMLLARGLRSGEVHLLGQRLLPRIGAARVGALFAQALDRDRRLRHARHDRRLEVSAMAQKETPALAVRVDLYCEVVGVDHGTGDVVERQGDIESEVKD